mmetsp:Transcript_21871/g.75218  ORF Transcript_21871/g.75218 Transcript_21871/m.75218 type:complete len:466 (-) Transcript_21871:442-1839(-)
MAFSKMMPMLLAVSARIRSVSAGLEASKLGKYPGYTGDLAVSGSVQVGQAGEDAVLWYDLKGTDPACAGVAIDKPNACGVHIHSGTSCESEQGGHFHTGSTDPWATVEYTTGAMAKDVAVKTGKTLAENTGRAFVVHDSIGDRVACSLLEAKDGALVASNFTKYPGYNRSLVVTGTVQVGASDNDTTLGYHLMGTDPACTGAAMSKANACGVHIHSGTSCEVDQGGHFHSGTTDPWATVTYTTEASAKNVLVKAGKTLVQNTGRAFVVHDSAGARIACALLKDDATDTNGALYVNALSKYPGYIGALVVAGNVVIEQVGSGAGVAQVLTFSLSGADVQCGVAKLEKPNACGIHVHEGTDCSSAGGHYYAKDLVSSDPWSPIVYFSDTNGSVASTISVEIGTGKPNTDMLNRTVVVHDLQGERVACGVIMSGQARGFGAEEEHSSDASSNTIRSLFTFLLALVLAS